jgi:hypothetical protein
MKCRNLLKILGISVILGGFSPAFATAADDAGEPMVVELLTTVSSEVSQVGDTVAFKVVEPLVVEGHVLIEAGRELAGVVTVARPSGRLGRAGRIGLEIMSEDLNGANMPLQIVRPNSEGARGKLGAVRRVTAPLARVGRAVLTLGGRDTAQAVQLAEVDPALAKELTMRTVGIADPLAEVELASDGKGSRLVARGVKAVARIGGGYVGTLLNGPAGALRAGGVVEVPAGAQVLVARK